MLVLGLDIGSSSIKASLFDVEKGISLLSDHYPKEEMTILSPASGWAEQDPDDWYRHVETVILTMKQRFNGSMADIRAIGISYQMHGLVTLDKTGHVVRNSIIWCDSRAVSIGNKAYDALGESYCLSGLLNSPGNFTASKLRWVKENEPENYERIHKIMLPGDYIAYRLTGEITTTTSGLSEGILWDFAKNTLAHPLLDHYAIDAALLPDRVPTFGIQGHLRQEVAAKLGLTPGIPVAYRAGDQPNNAFSLNVLQPGEVAATAGTSGVVYGVTDHQKPDRESRVNTFLHVNHTSPLPRLGTLLCINGTGILNAWMKNNILAQGTSYEDMNSLIETIDPGSDGLLVFPFGNGAERVLGNINLNAQIKGLDFNKHTRAHLLRASQEGIVFAMIYGIEVMQELGLDLKVVRAARANMFLSETFRQTFSTMSGAELELYNADGAQGAARGAALGAGFYKDSQDAFSTLKKVEMIEPQDNPGLQESYARWKSHLRKLLEDTGYE